MLLSFDKTNLAGAKAAIFPVTILSMGFVLFIFDKHFQHPWRPNKKWHLGNVNFLVFTFYKNTSCKNSLPCKWQLLFLCWCFWTNLFFRSWQCDWRMRLQLLKNYSLCTGFRVLLCFLWPKNMGIKKLLLTCFLFTLFRI